MELTDVHIGIRQFTKYAVVGLVSNAVLYAAYLGLTALGLPPKLAMSVLYAMGVVQTFIFNRNWTFQHTEKARRTFWKYGLTYFSGYIINLAVLEVFVDILGYPHAIVQGITILSLAVYLFLVQRYVVFRAGPQEDSSGE